MTSNSFVTQTRFGAFFGWDTWFESVFPSVVAWGFPSLSWAPGEIRTTTDSLQIRTFSPPCLFSYKVMFLRQSSLRNVVFLNINRTMILDWNMTMDNVQSLYVSGVKSAGWWDIDFTVGNFRKRCATWTRKLPPRGSTYWEASWTSDKPAQWAPCTSHLGLQFRPPYRQMFHKSQSEKRHGSLDGNSCRP
jgi:hypothetical protein